MILHNISGALRRHDWVTAMLEVFIVVVGIFIGLRADDWNQSRKDGVEASEFMERLHAELQTSVDFLQRLEDRQQSGWNGMISALDIVFGRSTHDALSNDECAAIGRSAYLVEVAVDLPSLNELRSSGRITIIQDIDLRLALAKLQQLSAATRNILAAGGREHLFVKYPELVVPDAYWSEQDNEVRLRFQCNLPAMRNDKGFLSDFSLNVDSFDGFYNQGVQRELEQLDTVHELVDQLLAIEHD